MGRGLRIVPKRDGNAQRRFWSSRWAPPCAALILSLYGPELANLHPDDQAAWTIYLTAKELASAVLCLTVAWCSTGRFLRIMACAVAAVFITQGVDEALEGNIFHSGVWEYPAVCGFLLLTALLTKLFPGEHDKG